jgi:imidazolonepropionase-like amidohydrolase
MIRIKSIFYFSFLFFIQIVFAQTIHFKNGFWYNGKTFVANSFYAINGTLAKQTKNKVDTIYDLKNKYIMPLLVDAHTHNLDGKAAFKEKAQSYIDEGVGYVGVLTNYNNGSKEVRPLINKAGSLDVKYTNAGFTCTLGHPFLSYEPYAMGLYNWWQDTNNLKKIKVSRIAEKKAYYFTDNKSDVDKVWDSFLKTKPDMVKIFLLDTKNHDALMVNGKMGDKGLSEDVAAYIVSKAHKVGLRVIAHIETVSDLKIGLKIGVDIFAHMPNYNYNFDAATELNELNFSKTELLRIKQISPYLIPTLSLNTANSTVYESSNNYQGTLDTIRFYKTIAYQKQALKILKMAGFKLAIGSDVYNQTLAPEYAYWFSNKIFDPEFIIHTMCQTSARLLYPNRKIGQLMEGYEASFITLDENPIDNWKSLQKIDLKIKQGQLLIDNSQ